MSLNRLIHNELYKLFHRKSFLITMIIMLGLVILINYISSVASKIIITIDWTCIAIKTLTYLEFCKLKVT
jgi:hypothetical protein